MGDEYTFDDYECVVESYDLGEVSDDDWGDEEYSQGDQYAAMADRHCVQQLVSVFGSMLRDESILKNTWLVLTTRVALCYNE